MYKCIQTIFTLPSLQEIFTYLYPPKISQDIQYLTYLIHFRSQFGKHLPLSSIQNLVIYLAPNWSVQHIIDLIIHLRTHFAFKSIKHLQVLSHFSYNHQQNLDLYPTYPLTTHTNLLSFKTNLTCLPPNLLHWIRPACCLHSPIPLLIDNSYPFVEEHVVLRKGLFAYNQHINFSCGVRECFHHTKDARKKRKYCF